MIVDTVPAPKVSCVFHHFAYHLLPSTLPCPTYPPSYHYHAPYLVHATSHEVPISAPDVTTHEAPSLCLSQSQSQSQPHP
ncbi:hypothetical protein PMIN04_008643 [Paraphaeosphaeria minitans]